MDKGIQKATAAIVLNSLGGGVVPRVGLEYITVGRRNEIGALLQDVELIQAGGSAIRFIEGRYGSGKTFLLYALKNDVLERNFVVSDVELSVDKRLVGNKGQGIAAYREMLRNLATKGCPDQGALKPVLDKWISELENEVEQESGLIPGHESFDIKVSQKVHRITSSLEEKVNGFDFAKVLSIYYKGHRMGDDKLQQKAFRWMCGENRTKSDEPASALDPISTAKVEELIHELKKQYTIVIVTHNMQQAARVSDSTAFFYMGEMVEFGDTKKIFTNPDKVETQNYITGRFG